jgi:hypothetical protein
MSNIPKNRTLKRHKFSRSSSAPAAISDATTAPRRAKRTAAAAHAAMQPGIRRALGAYLYNPEQGERHTVPMRPRHLAWHGSQSGFHRGESDDQYAVRVAAHNEQVHRNQQAHRREIEQQLVEIAKMGTHGGGGANLGGKGGGGGSHKGGRRKRRRKRKSRKRKSRKRKRRRKYRKTKRRH